MCAPNGKGTNMKRWIRILVALAMLSATALMGSAAPAIAAGATQVSGLGLPGLPGDAPCDDPAHAGADYSIAMSGDLEGCIYGYVTSFRFHEASGTYQEVADEVFVGSYGWRTGTFEMVENFTAKFDPATGDQIFGRCKHPIVAGSGEGDFAGVTGRLDFKDDVGVGNAPYTGHLSFG